MTNPNKTHITIVADRSGSMASMKADAQGGINAFIEDQKKVPGDCTLYFTEFDTGPETVVHDGNLADARSYTLTPRGGTALLDAIGKAIHETGRRLAALAEDERPAHVFFVVQTDGGENSSVDFTLPQITDMIKDHENTWKWNFIFLATGPEAFAQSQMFVGTQMTNNTMRNDHNTISHAYYAASASVGQTRSGVKGVTYGGDVRKDEDREGTSPSR